MNLREKWILFRVFCQLKSDALRLDLAIFMANALQRAQNKRFYVIRNAHNKLIWVCNDDIRQMKQPRRVRRLINGQLRTFKVRLLGKNVTHMDIMRECLYYTPIDRNNSNGISVEERNAKRAGWLEYMERIRMDRMYGKLRVKK
jgi:hypothetical protein